MNTTRTLEITIPDGYTEAEVREHLERLPEKKPAAGTVAYFTRYPSLTQANWDAISAMERHMWGRVEFACREGYVERDKIEAALAERFGMTADGSAYQEGYLAGHSRLSQLIREAMK